MSIFKLENYKSFRASLSSNAQVYSATDAQYEDARLTWNYAYPAKPSAIIWCATAQDVQHAVKFLVEHKLDFTVAGGRHSRFCVKEGAVQINLGGLRTVRVDPEQKLVYVQGGARNLDLDTECSKYGMYTPAGTNPDTGVGGLISGGGYGYLSTSYGFSVDNLVNAEIVTADGQLVNANAKENSELFWGIRGAAFNFGIVTEFTLRLHKIGHVERPLSAADEETIAKYGLPDQSSLVDKVMGGLVIYPFPAAAAALAELNSFALDDNSPKDVMTGGVIMNSPHGPAFGRILTYFGPNMYEGLKSIEPARKLQKSQFTPVVDAVHPMTYLELQHLFEPYQRADYYHERAVMVNELTPTVIAILSDHFAKLPEGCEKTAILIFATRVGKGFEVDPDSTALSPDARHARFWIAAVLNYKPEVRDAGIAWIDQLKTLLRPHVTGYYINNIDADDKITELFTQKHHNRLRALKTQYDPTNIFHNNNNVLPL